MALAFEDRSYEQGLYEGPDAYIETSTSVVDEDTENYYHYADEAPTLPRIPTRRPPIVNREVQNVSYAAPLVIKQENRCKSLPKIHGSFGLFGLAGLFGLVAAFIENPSPELLQESTNPQLAELHDTPYDTSQRTLYVSSASTSLSTSQTTSRSTSASTSAS